MLLLLAGAKVLRAYIHDAVGVDIEGNFDLGHAARSRSDAVQVEAYRGSCCRAANSRSPCRTLTSTLGWLSAAVEKIWLFLVGMVVLRSMMLGANAAQGLNAQGQRGNVQQQQALDVAAAERRPGWQRRWQRTHPG